MSETKEKTPIKPEDYNPEDVAAAFFSMNDKRLINNLRQLSKRQLERVCYHVASHGLGAKPVKLNDELEKNTAYVMLEMITNRVIMQLHLEMEKAEKASLQSVENHDIIKPSLEEAGQILENKNG